jgi:cytochrome c biogenesis protein CcmG/thiol:disulfide interchange protein DsbE
MSSLPTLAEPSRKTPAPALTITSADGQQFDLAALRGKVVLVNFWATWCGPCLAEMPAIAEFHKKHHTEGFEVIALSIDKPQDRQKMLKLLAKLPYPGALASDATRNGFGIPEAVPVSYVVDAKGIIRDTFVEIDTELLDEVVLPLLKQTSVKPTATERRSD